MLKWLLLGLVGCGDSKAAVDAGHAIDAEATDAKLADAPHIVDAAGPDLSCSGVPTPTTAPDPVTVSGTVVQLTQVGALPEADVTVDGFAAGNAMVLGTAVSDAQGNYSESAATGGVAKVGYARLTKTGLVTSYDYAALPVYQNISGAIDAIVAQSTIDTLASQAQVTQSASDGMLSIYVQDCAGQPIAGALLTSPSGAVFYAHMGEPSLSATATDASGQVFVFNVPPGDVTVAGTLGSTILRSHVIGSYAGSPSFSTLQP